MNQYKAFLLSFLLLISLCACSNSKNQASGEQDETPQSMPELESIVEPIYGDDASAGDESEAPQSDIDEPPPVSASEPSVLEAEQDIPVLQAPKPAADSVPEQKSESSAPELFGAVAADNRLDCGTIEKELLRLINSLRDENGGNALGVEDSMQFAARIRASEALESFSHTRPDGATYNTAFDEAGFSYAGKWHGENLSSLSFSPGMFDEKKIALEMFNGLKSSPGHYRNMTEAKFVQAGVGVAIIYGEYSIDVASAQMFSSL